jgi:hypothetical protein
MHVLFCKDANIGEDNAILCLIDMCSAFQIAGHVSKKIQVPQDQQMDIAISN